MKKIMAPVMAACLFLTAVTSVMATSRSLSNGTYTAAGSLASPAPAALPLSIADKKLGIREEGLEIKGKLPVISGLHDLDAGLNNQIANVYQQKVAGAKESKARSISFDYERKVSSDIVSLLIYSTTVTATSKAEVSSLNFNASQERLVTVNDILGPNGLQLANKVISSRIKSDPDQYYPNFSGLQENHAFELADGDIIFLFDAFQIAPGSKGIIRFALNRNSIVSYVALKNNGAGYWTKNESYGLKMVSLRPVCAALGYTLGWDTSDHSITVQRPGESMISMSVRDNAYKSMKTDGSDKYVKRSLEAPPEMLDGAT
ncbi:MAG: DUF3298 domain-containing protein, partial [Clostridiales bacterium]|nr:DUF3298 domain-containing protein [Clostridiales bacterium]